MHVKEAFVNYAVISYAVILFNQINLAADRLYQPLAAEQGDTLSIIGDWESESVVGYVDRYNHVTKIYMPGGFYRHPLVTPEAYALGLCHELGHVFGGEPYYIGQDENDPGGRISAEGQADYYAVRECLPKLLASCDNCEAKAVYSFITFINKYIPGNVSFDTPDINQVEVTNATGYPSLQCRMDTMYRRERRACWFKK